MFIEFQLLDLPGMPLELIKNEVEKWSERYSIPYTSKTVKYTYRVCFDQEKLYTFFATTWNNKFEYQLVDRRW